MGDFYLSDIDLVDLETACGTGFEKIRCLIDGLLQVVPFELLFVTVQTQIHVGIYSQQTKTCSLSNPKAAFRLPVPADRLSAVLTMISYPTVLLGCASSKHEHHVLVIDTSVRKSNTLVPLLDFDSGFLFGSRSRLIRPSSSFLSSHRPTGNLGCSD